MNKPIKSKYKTKTGYDNAMKRYRDFQAKQNKLKSSNKINKTERKNLKKIQTTVNKGKKGLKKFVKTNAPKIKNRALKIGKGAFSSGLGIATAAASLVAEKGINQVVDRGFKQLKKSTRGKNMTLAEYRAKRDAAVKNENSTRGINRIPGAIKNAVKNTQGKSPSLADSKFNSSNIGNQPSKKKTKLTGKEKAQALAKKRIGRGTAKNPDKTIASVNAANKKKMRDAARKRNEAFQRNRKLKIKKRKNKNKAGSKYPTLANIK